MVKNDIMTEISLWLKMIFTEISLQLKMILTDISLWLKIILTERVSLKKQREVLRYLILYLVYF